MPDSLPDRGDAGQGDELRPSSRYDLSVVVPSVNGVGSLLECLDALRADAADGLALEILVIDRCGEAVRRAVGQRYPEMRVLPAAPETTIPELRTIGFRQARADNVAVIEDHVLVRRGWSRQLVAALAVHDVVGGSVCNAATTSVIDRAAFLCEYSQLMPPLSAGSVETLAGNNVAYRRAVLERYLEVLSSGRWEDALHAAMRRDGIVLACHPEICVDHKMHDRTLEYLAQRYLYARSYAGLRRLEMTAATRALFALGAVVLPPVLLARIGTRVFVKRRHRVDFLRSLPLVALFVCAWAAGEAIGYAAGPGDALSRVR